MKFNTAAFALLTVAAQAAAIDSSSNYPRAIFENGVGFSATKGQAGYVAKRAAEAVAEAIADPRRKGGSVTFCGAAGMGCNEKREARIKGGAVTFCGAAGMGCNEKRQYVDNIYNAAHKAFNAIEAREASAHAEALAEAHTKGGVVTFCGAPGMGCNEKRSEDQLGRRMAGPDAHTKGGVVTFCGAPGMGCNERRSAEPVAAPRRKGGSVTFCGAAGMGCNEKREALQQMKRAFPNIERDECYSEDGPCTQIEDAAQALEEVKRSLADGEESAVANVHKMARSEGKSEAELAEREADGPDGANTLARRALQDLEDAINEGVAAIAKM